MFSITIYNKVQNYIFFLIFTSNPQYLTLFKTPTPCHPITFLTSIKTSHLVLHTSHLTQISRPQADPKKEKGRRQTAPPKYQR